MKQIFQNTALLLGLSSVVFFGLGCNPFQGAKDKINDKISEKVTEGVLSNISGGDVDVNKDGEEVHFKDNKTGNEVSYGDDLKLPDNFPKSVPVYPDAKIKGVMISNDTIQNATITLGTDDELSKVLKWYEDQVKDSDWEEEQSWSFDNMETRGYSKGDENVTFSISAGQENATDDMKTVIITSYSKDTSDSDVGGGDEAYNE